MKAILGRKLRMTRMYTEEGHLIPLTAVEVGPCPITQIKTNANDHYNAIQIGFLPVKEKVVTQPMLGHFKKANVEPQRILKEVRVENADGFEVGQNLDASQFEEGDCVDVTGTSKGRGFQGGVRRHNWHGGKKSHGSMFHRRVGAVSPGTGLARVFPGKNLPGQMGNERVTLHNLKVMKVDTENNILYVRGGIPGPNGSVVFIKATTKTQKQKKKK